MKTNATNTVVLLLILLCIAPFAKAQLNYQPGGFSTNITTYVDLGLNGDTIPIANHDDAFSPPLPIGFSFNFNGAIYDSFVFSTNGFIKLGTDSASRHFLFTTFAQPPANGPFTSTTSPTPLASDTSLLFAFGQDLIDGEYRYFMDGSPGSRVCTIQWKNVKDKLQNATPGLCDTINFQIKLYETSNVVEYVYGPWTATVSFSAARFSAVGIVGNNFVVANQNLHLVKGSTVGWGAAVANTGFYINNAVNYRNPTSVPAGPLPELGRTYRFTPLTLNDAAVRTIYAQGKIGMVFYQPDSIKVNIFNPGLNDLTSLNVNLDITGDHTFSATATIPFLAAGGNITVGFPPFTPTTTGSSLITVSVPSDDNNANNIGTYGLSITDYEMGYRDTIIPHTGSNGITIPNFWGARYFINGTGIVTEVRSFLVSNSDATGDTVCGMVMDMSGNILGRSPNYIVQPSDLGTWMHFTMTLPPTVSNQSIIVGIAGGFSVNGINYFLGTSQNESPQRPDNPFYFMTQGNGITNANVGTQWSFPVLWNNTPPTRLMMECTVEPLPDNDIGITGAFPPVAVKIPVNLPVTMKAVVRNHGLMAQPAGLEVRYRVNGGPVIGPVLTSSIVNSLDTISVEFSGANSLNFTSPGTYHVQIYTSMMGDAIIGNDSFSITYIAENPATIPYRISNNILGTWSVQNPNTPLWKQRSAVQANGTLDFNVLWADNITTINVEGKVISPTFDFSTVTKPMLHFNVAHAGNTILGTDDTLEVMASTDGGFTYTSLFMKSGLNSTPMLATDTAILASYEPAFASDWRHETVNLSSLAGQPFVIIAFRDKSASGNGVYIGDISLTDASNTSSQPVGSPSLYSSNNVYVTFSGIGDPAGELNITSYTGAPASTASPVFETNTTATTNSGAIFTPDNVSASEWHTITYSGINAAFPPGTVPYTVSFDMSAMPGILMTDSIYIMKRANFNDSWVPVSSTVAGAMISTVIMNNGFSDFALGSVATSNPLPVDWFGFTGKSLSRYENYLSWTTASEQNNDYFMVERSMDQKTFASIQKVKSQGNSNRNQSYSFVDALNTPATGNIYYRIKQVDMNGKFSHSKILTIKPYVQTAMDVTISNPFEGAPVIYFNNNQKARTMTIVVTDITGKTVIKRSFELIDGNNEIFVEDFGGVKNGMYFTNIQIDDNQLNTKKLLKVK